MSSYSYSINSAKRPSPTTTSSTNYTAYLSQPLVANSSVQLLLANIPVTSYNVTATNNLIDFVDNNGTLVATITPGAYTSTTLCAAILAALNAASNNYSTVTYDATGTLFITVTRTANFQLLGSTGANAKTSLLPQLGFVTDTASAKTSVGTRAYNVNQPNNIYCSLSELGFNGLTAYGFQYTFVLTLNTNTNGISIWTVNAYFPQVITLSRRISLTALTVKLFYEDGTILDLNGVDWQMILGTN